MGCRMRFMYARVLILSLFLATGLRAVARDFYVATNGSDLTAADWDTAYTNLQRALDEAAATDVIYVAGQSFRIGASLLWQTADVTIQGGYAATNSAVLPGTRDPSMWPTVLGRPTSTTNRILQIVNVTNGTLSGLTIANGLSTETIGGGGVLATGCSNLTITGCMIVSNATVVYGNNLGNINGGGMTCSNTVGSILDTVFRENRVETTQASTMSYGNGGGLAVIGGRVTVSESLFDLNSLTTAQNAYGAGLYLYGGVHGLADSVFTRNSAIFSYNSNYRGDGIHVGGSAVVAVTNVALIGNLRDGVHLESGTLQMIHCTVAANGQYGVRRVAGTLSVTNSIVWANGADINGTVDLGYSLVGNSVLAGTNGIISVNPSFECGVYLVTNSPAVNAGTNTATFWGLDGRVTGTNGQPDVDAADLGYHASTSASLTAADTAVAFVPSRAELYVAPGGSDLADGTNAAAPLRSITRALVLASAGSRIHVASGLYTNGVETFPLAVRTQGIRILGANASDTFVRASGSSKRVMEIWGVLGGQIEGLTLTGGAGDVPVYYGTQAYRFDSFVNRRSAGGLLVVASRVALSGLTVSNNTVSGRANEHTTGAGIGTYASQVSLSNSLIAHNRLIGGQSNTGDGYGAGLFLYQGSWDVGACVISNNIASFGNNGGNYGGGVYMDGAHTIHHTTIVANQASGRGDTLRRGSGVYLVSGTVSECEIVGNTMPFSTSADTVGGGVYQTGGVLRNSCVQDNASLRGGGGIYATGGQIQNVTVGGNHASEPTAVAGVVLGGTAAVTNSVIGANTSTFDGQELNINASGGSVGYTAVSPLRSGVGNTDADPNFVDAAGDFRLRPGSPATDAAYVLPWMAGAEDVDGNPRTRGTGPDMGAYEAAASNEGPLLVSFSADETTGRDTLDATLSAVAAGSNTTGLVYRWDYNGDASFDESGVDKQTVSHSFTTGFHTVTLEVENGIGEIASHTRSLYIKVYPSIVYVWSGGDHTTGGSWDTAFTNLHAAISFLGATSTLCLAGETFSVTQAIVLAGLSSVEVLGGYEATNTPVGPGAFDSSRWPTVIRRESGSVRLLDVATVVSGRIARVTFTGGNIPSDITKGVGGGIRIVSSSLELDDCVISNNQANANGNGYGWGGGLYATGSRLTVRRSLFHQNRARTTGGSNNNRALGGAIATENCTVVLDRNRFTQNDAHADGHHGSLGGALYLSGGTNQVRNCLFYGNRAGVTRPLGQGGAVYLVGSTILENCTIVSNQVYHSVTNTGGGVAQVAGAITNCIIAFNTVSNLPNNLAIASFNAIGYSCAPELTNAANGNITADPQFVDFAGTNLLLVSASPCVNAGLNLPWMSGSVDLAEGARIRSGRVDMGAFETAPQGSYFIIH